MEILNFFQEKKHFFFWKKIFFKEKFLIFFKKKNIFHKTSGISLGEKWRVGPETKGLLRGCVVADGWMYDIAGPRPGNDYVQKFVLGRRWAVQTGVILRTIQAEEDAVAQEEPEPH